MKVFFESINQMLYYILPRVKKKSTKNWLSAVKSKLDTAFALGYLKQITAANCPLKGSKRPQATAVAVIKTPIQSALQENWTHRSTLTYTWLYK